MVTLTPLQGALGGLRRLLLAAFTSKNRKGDGCKRPMLRFVQWGFEIVRVKIIFNCLLGLMESLTFAQVFYLFDP